VVRAFLVPTYATVTTVELVDGQLTRQLKVGSDLEGFVAALELLTSVRGGAPVLRREVDPSVSFLLRDFYLALEERDPGRSDLLLKRIEESALLGGDNLRFLKVERLARLGRWAELSALPWIAELARARRPRRISEHLVEALWHTRFDEAAVMADPAVAGVALHAIAASYGPLLRAVDVPGTRAGRRLAMVAAAEDSDQSRIERIRAAAQPDEQAVLGLLSRARPEETEGGRRDPAPELANTLALAREASDEGRYTTVVDLAEQDPQPVMLELAVRAAIELDDPMAADRVVALLDEGGVALPDSRATRIMVEEIRRLADRGCSGWQPWFDRLADGSVWVEAPEVARDLAAGWSLDPFRSGDLTAELAERLFEASSGPNRRVVGAALDVVIPLAARLIGQPIADPFVDAVLLVIADQESPSRIVLDAFLGLISDALESGVSAERYCDLLDASERLWQVARSRAALLWLLDLGEVFAAAACPDPDARRGMVERLAVSVEPWTSQFRPHERLALEAIASECGAVVVLAAEPPTDADAPDPWVRLEGQLVGLYSLLAGAGARLRDRVLRLCPSAQVEWNADEVGSEALRNLALRADVLVVDTRHAAHAATMAIDQVRPRDRQVFPVGRGVSSFLAALEQELDDAS
jgi:hypothetical protein